MEQVRTNARETLAVHDVSDAQLDALAKACATPEALQVVTRLMYQYAKTHPHQTGTAEGFFARVDASPFPLSQWTEALMVFQAWLERQRRPTDLAKMLGYLECCGASSEAARGAQTLPTIVVSMLAEHGFNG